MKQLQNNFTTPEQSKRLLELGVPADSADCIWWSDDNFTSGLYDLSIIHYNRTFSDDRRLDKNGEVANLQKLPCWSVGRLIEIELLCREKRDGQIARLYFVAEDDPIDADTIGQSNITEGLIRYMESALYKYDFSKLEE